MEKNILKVLPFKALNERHKALIIREGNKYYTKITPKIGKDGWYYNRHEGIAWKELDGQAWLDSRVDDFLYNLELLNHRPLLLKEKKALVLLKRNKLTSKEQNRMLYIDNCIAELRDITIRTVLFRKKVISK